MTFFNNKIKEICFISLYRSGCCPISRFQPIRPFIEWIDYWLSVRIMYPLDLKMVINHQLEILGKELQLLNKMSLDTFEFLAQSVLRSWLYGDASEKDAVACHTLCYWRNFTKFSGNLSLTHIYILWNVLAILIRIKLLKSCVWLVAFGPPCI